MLYSLETRRGTKKIRLKMVVAYGLLDSHHVFKVDNNSIR